MKSKPICFVIMGYGEKTDHASGNKYDLNKTYEHIIKPAASAAGYQCVRGDEIIESGLIDRSMYTMLVHAELVIADISTYNPNAIYELGIRHAAKPYSTIIMKEEDGNIPFDLSHNKVFKYKHLGVDIGKSEVDRCVRHLQGLIETITKNPQVDSPLFEFIGSIKPHSIDPDEYISIIKELNEKSNNVYTLMTQARLEMDKDNFEEAKKLWLRLSKLVPNEIYFIQQLALATYKSGKPSENVSLIDALQIIHTLNPDETTDPETLGITGAIYKRLWFNTVDIVNLDRATKYYKKGFQIHTDYYTGENYAMCLLLKAAQEKQPEEKMYYQIEAKKTCEAVVEHLKNLIEGGEHENRNDLRWIYASYSTCSLILGEMADAEFYKKLFEAEKPVEWQRKTFETTVNQFVNLLP